MVHTPTPWEYQPETEKGWGENDYVVVGADKQPVFVATSYYPVAPDRDDAAFIVRAVNSHDRLVEVLKKFMDYSDSEYVPNALFDRARAALEGL